MKQHADHIIGIVGGMGPEAGIALSSSILRHTRAATDQQHFSTMLMSLPRYIGDRSAFLAGKIPQNPAYNIAKIIGMMEKAGATVFGMACNTAHAPTIFDVILAELKKSR